MAILEIENGTMFPDTRKHYITVEPVFSEPCLLLHCTYVTTYTGVSVLPYVTEIQQVQLHVQATTDILETALC